MGGSFVTKQKALVDFTFPEFSDKKHITHTVHVDSRPNPSTASYDMIIGSDLMEDLGIILDYSEKEVRWEGHTVPMKERGTLKDDDTLQFLYEIHTEPPQIQEAEERRDRILDADYSAVDIDKYVCEQKHLDSDQKAKLQEVLKSHPTLFGGGLGTLKVDPVHIELKPGSKPYHHRLYPIPQSQVKTTKKEMGRLTDIGVFKEASDSEWAAPTFVQPKKTGDVRILTDFRKLNACIVRKPFPLPKISDILLKLSGFKYATAIDLSMGYYHIPIDEESQKLCSTVLPWGKYQYKRLPMGMANAPDIFQKVMTDVLGDLDFVLIYIDDILITSDGTYEDHMEKLEIVLQRLEEKGFRANVRKCYFAEAELEYLGYLLTRDGIAPQPKKVEAVLRIKEPKNRKELRHFLGLVNYYRDMWRKRSHLLAPLSSLVSKNVPWKWGKEQQKSFDELKKVISKETLLAFPDFNKEFHVYTDASDYQMGAVIMQDNKPIAFYSRKLNQAQRRYTTGEQELLSIVETLKEFKNILFGQKLIVHTDHMNILYGNLSNDRITRWRLFLEEYSPEFKHVKGKDNVVADALSRMEMKNVEAQHVATCMAALTRDEGVDVPDGRDHVEMSYEFGATDQDIEREKFPMRPKLISHEQKKDPVVSKLLGENAKGVTVEHLEDADLVCLNGRVIVPKSLRKRIIEWYHTYLAHPGIRRMTDTMSKLYFWPKMEHEITQQVKTCKECQLNKKGKRSAYGKLPPKEAEDSEPWKRVNVDLMGPFTVKTKTGK